MKGSFSVTSITKYQKGGDNTNVSSDSPELRKRNSLTRLLCPGLGPPGASGKGVSSSFQQLEVAYLLAQVSFFHPHSLHHGSLLSASRHLL